MSVLTPIARMIRPNAQRASYYQTGRLKGAHALLALKNSFLINSSLFSYMKSLKKCDKKIALLISKSVACSFLKLEQETSGLCINPDGQEHIKCSIIYLPVNSMNIDACGEVLKEVVRIFPDCEIIPATNITTDTNILLSFENLKILLKTFNIPSNDKEIFLGLVGDLETSSGFRELANYVLDNIQKKRKVALASAKKRNYNSTNNGIVEMFKTDYL